MVKFRLVNVLTVGLVMFLSASMVTAQEQGQGQRRQPGGGGRGGFGGGLGGALSLITNEAVQKELATDSETNEKLKKVSDDARREVRDIPGNGGGREAFQGLSDDERRAKIAEMVKKSTEERAKITAKYQPQVKEILTETQYQRLQQIYWQSNLTAALADPEVIKAINLTQEEQDKIAAVSKDYEAKFRELFPRGGNGGNGGDFREAMAKRAELNKERDTKITDVLSAEQKEKFASLKGKAFDVAQLRGGFGGGRGGRGNGGNGGRPAN